MAVRLKQFFSGKPPSCDAKPPYLLKYRSSTPFILFTISLAIFTDIFLYGLIVPVIPFSLTVQAGVAEDQVQQWTAILLACYNITLFVGSPIVGWYADCTTSRRLPLLLGLLALAGSTLLLCLGKTIALFIVGRLLQGLSASVVWSVGLALLVDTMGKNIGAAMGWVSIAMSVGLLISPVVGGAVYAGAGYYAVYYLAFGIIFLDIVLRLVLIEKKVARQWIKDEDEGEAVEGAGTDTSSTLGISSGLEKGVVDREAADQGEISGGDSSEKTASSPPGGEKLEPVSSPSHDTPTGEIGPAKHPYLELIKSKRILAALLGTVFEAGVM